MSKEFHSTADNTLIFFTHGKEAQYLCELDDELGTLIHELEVVSLELDSDDFRALARAIVDQQISIHAARAIWERLEEYCSTISISASTKTQLESPAFAAAGVNMPELTAVAGTGKRGGRKSGHIGSFDFVRSQSFVTAEAVAAANAEKMRICGLSRTKIATLKDLAAHIHDGRIDFDQLANLTDEEVIEILTQVKGIGRWTAQMHLIFALGRQDVFASADGALRRAVEQLKGLPPKSPPELIEAIAEEWAPYRSVAALYLWKSLNKKSAKKV
jgi:3-methyladenine DNA glycosylase/8-oxoguanine DNA glycosylase